MLFGGVGKDFHKKMHSASKVLYRRFGAFFVFWPSVHYIICKIALRGFWWPLWGLCGCCKGSRPCNPVPATKLKIYFHMHVEANAGWTWMVGVIFLPTTKNPDSDILPLSQSEKPGLGRVFLVTSFYLMFTIFSSGILKTLGVSSLDLNSDASAPALTVSLSTTLPFTSVKVAGYLLPSNAVTRT